MSGWESEERGKNDKALSAYRVHKHTPAERRTPAGSPRLQLEVIFLLAFMKLPCNDAELFPEFPSCKRGLVNFLYYPNPILFCFLYVDIFLVLICRQIIQFLQPWNKYFKVIKKPLNHSMRKNFKVILKKRPLFRIIKKYVLKTIVKSYGRFEFYPVLLLLTKQLHLINFIRVYI